jgi:hypothetical protein
MLFLVSPLLKKSWYFLSFSRTRGIVESYLMVRNVRRARFYPEVKFIVNNDTLYCTGSSFQKEGLHTNDSVTVIYDPKNARHAYEGSFLGFWAPDLVYILPFGLLLSLMVLGLEEVPTYLKLKI